MLPKQRQVQNSTLRIQMPASTVSGLAIPPSIVAAGSADGSADDTLCVCVTKVVDGARITSGLTLSRNRVPAAPTIVDTTSAAMVRSISHQRKMLTSAMATETCVLDVHARRRCVGRHMSAQNWSYKLLEMGG